VRGAQYSHNLIKTASQMFTYAVQLLPTAIPRALHRDGQPFSLSQFVGLAADASALSIRSQNDVIESLRLLELRRVVMAGIHLEMRSNSIFI
jgi:hypothetical protein